MEFEWDENKRAVNVAKHGIDFVDAVTIWNSSMLDPFAERVMEGERRVTAIGLPSTSEIIIAVVYTLRSDTIRIISARRARRNEREDYKDQFGQGA
jgi:uncharacterized DUF497 family protein